MALLAGFLIGAFVWWRIAAQYAGVERFWARPLAGSAEAMRTRAATWLTARREGAQVVAAMVAADGGRTATVHAALATLFRLNGTAFASLHLGDSVIRCEPAPTSTRVVCRPGSGRFVPPSADHPQARRTRPTADARVLVPVVASVRRPSGALQGTLTLWVDPEAGLIPELLRAGGAVPGASTYFVRRDGDSVTVLGADSLGVIAPRERVAVAALAPLLAHPALEGEVLKGRGPDGVERVAASVYVPRLRWYVYRSIPRTSAYATFRSELRTEGTLAFLLGAFVVGLLVWTIRERREQRVRAELILTRLEGLQAQLRPHFLFNALNTIATLVHEDADAAERMLQRMADLLRLSLEQSHHVLVPVRRELEILEAYVQVERVRFGDALRVGVVAGPDVLDVMMPPWILQPLVENAIKHGGAYGRGQARIDITITRRDDRLHLLVADDGPRLIPDGAAEHVGLGNTRSRLATLYGRDAHLSLGPRASHGAEVLLDLPVVDAASVAERLHAGSTQAIAMMPEAVPQLPG